MVFWSRHEAEVPQNVDFRCYLTCGYREMKNPNLLSQKNGVEQVGAQKKPGKPAGDSPQHVV